MTTGAGNLKRGAVFQRFEAKYFLGELEAQAILEFIRPYVALDPHAPEGGHYPINSLYLDSPDLQLFHSSLFGEKNRFKLRIRSYDDAPDAPVFFEIKRRMDQVILKQRVDVKRGAVPALLGGSGYTPGVLVRPSEREMIKLLHFRDLMEGICAMPKCMVRYMREAYMSDFEEPVRISFDRRLSTLPALAYEDAQWTYGPHWMPVDFPEVVMEIKFTDAFPRWVHRMIQYFELPRVSAAKYVECVKTLNSVGIPLHGSPMESII